MMLQREKKGFMNDDKAYRSRGSARIVQRAKANWLALGAFVAVMGIGLNGCARGVISTTVNPNGSWVRKVTFHGAKPDKKSISIGQNLEDVIVLPKGAEWKITQQDKDSEIVYTAERTLPAGGTLHGDIATKGAKNQPTPLVINDVSVQQIAPGIFRYKETLHWKGEPAKDLTPDKDIIANVKKALPTALATNDNAEYIATQFTHAFWRVLFGPNEPLLAEFSALMIEPEIVVRKILQRFSAKMDTILQRRFGAQLTAEQRFAITKSLVGESVKTVSAKSKDNAVGGGGKEENHSSISLIVSVKMPGRLLETNGERDTIEGDVYWSFYPEAAALEDVVLTATCDTNQQPTR